MSIIISSLHSKKHSSNKPNIETQEQAQSMLLSIGTNYGMSKELAYLNWVMFSTAEVKQKRI